MAVPRDRKLYEKVKMLADDKFGQSSSVHKSSWIVQTYKRLGGTYVGKKPESSGIRSWYKTHTGGSPQYYGKRSSVYVQVPSSVKRWALYAFKLRKLGFKGALETGWKRAKQLATKSEIPIQDVRYMRNWFARHIVTSYPTFRAWQKAGRPKDKQWHNRRGIIAWLTWAGNAGFRWVNSKRVIKLLNDMYGKDYQPIKWSK